MIRRLSPTLCIVEIVGIVKDMSGGCIGTRAWVICVPQCWTARWKAMGLVRQPGVANQGFAGRCLGQLMHA